MESSYNLAKSLFPRNLISKHWDIYPDNFKKSLFNSDKIKNFRSNDLSFKFNDSLEKGMLMRTKRALEKLTKITGREFIETNKETMIGNPKTFYIDNEYYDYHDLFIIYFYHSLVSFLSEKRDKEIFFVCEIGGGYGGLIHRIKKNFPEAVCLLFDLPEQNYISNYYLKRLNPKAKVLNLKGLMSMKKTKSLDSIKIEKDDLKKFDFVILPGYLIEKIHDSFIDVFINTRSFMEMNLETIYFYFSEIHRLVCDDGLFYCVNRYRKETSGDLVKFKRLPFDKKWTLEVSRRSFYQPLIHEAMLRRSNLNNNSLKKQLSKLKPYDIEFFSSFI